MTKLSLERNSGLITEGTHLFMIVKVEEKASATSGDPMIVLTLRCIDSSGEDRDKELATFLSLSPKARFKIDELLDALNYPKNGEVSIEEFAGKRLRCAIQHGDYNGKETANVFRMVPEGYNGEIVIPAKKTNGSTSGASSSSANGASEPSKSKSIF